MLLKPTLATDISTLKAWNTSWSEFQSSSSFLVIYQSANMKHLMLRYGAHVLLDATYRTTKYGLSLFFVAVKTNVDTQVVAAFVTEDEKMVTVAAALTHIKTVNPEWAPKTFVVDCHDSEIGAIQETFPGKNIKYASLVELKQLGLHRFERQRLFIYLVCLTYWQICYRL